MIDMLYKRLAVETDNPEDLMGYVREYAPQYETYDDPNYRRKVRELLYTVASNEHLPTEGALRLFKLHDDVITASLIKSTKDKKVLAESLEHLPKKTGSVAYANLLRNPNTPTDVLDKVASKLIDRDDSTRHGRLLIVRHNNCSQKTKKEIQEYEDRLRQEKARRRGRYIAGTPTS